MSEEEKKELLDEETEEEEVSSTEDEIEDEDIEEEESESVDESIDYKAELAEREERIHKQDAKIIKLKKKLKEKGTDEKEDTTSVDAVIDHLLDEQIDTYTNDEDERKLILSYLEEHPPKSLRRADIKESVENAYVLANKKRIVSLIKAKHKKQSSDRLAGTKTSESSAVPENSPKVTAHDRKMADRFFGGDVKKWLKYKN